VQKALITALALMKTQRLRSRSRLQAPKNGTLFALVSASAGERRSSSSVLFKNNITNDFK
jgi:hypothetical protein